MNPGKIIETPGIRENLRIGPGVEVLDVSTYLDFSEDGGFAGHVEMCNSQGACRKLDGGMCPSFMATREEEHSTRARATMLRMVISGKLPAEELTGKRLYETMDLCVECKACKAECPSNVDMAKLKSEVLSKYYEKHGVPLRARLFGEVARLSRIGQAVAPVTNFMGSLPPTRLITERVLGISRKRPLPRVRASQVLLAVLAARSVGERDTRRRSLLPRHVHGVHAPGGRPRCRPRPGSAGLQRDRRVAARMLRQAADLQGPTREGEGTGRGRTWTYSRRMRSAARSSSARSRHAS